MPLTGSHRHRSAPERPLGNRNKFEKSFQRIVLFGKQLTGWDGGKDLGEVASLTVGTFRILQHLCEEPELAKDTALFRAVFKGVGASYSAE